MLVLDASAVTGWVMPDETGLDLDRLIPEHGQIAAPWLIWAELRNILIVSERHGRLPAGMAEQIATTVDALGGEMDTAPDQPVVFDLARRHGLTVYDALYLELALRRGAVLATLDPALLRGAKAEGIATV